MPISLNHIKNDKRSIAIDYNGDTLNLTYKPSELTPAIEAEIREEALEGRNDRLIETVCKMVIQWDLLDEAGEPLPLEPEIVRDLPSAFLYAIQQGCREDMIPKSKSGRK